MLEYVGAYYMRLVAGKPAAERMALAQGISILLAEGHGASVVK